MIFWGIAMKSFFKRIVGFIIFAALIVSCAGCGNDTEPSTEPQLLLGFSQIGSESAWRIGNTRDIEEAAEQNGISLMLENANQKQENQIAALRRFIAYKVDVIAFSPIVEDGWDNVLEEAKAAGIPVVLVDRDISTKKEGLTSCLIGADFYKEGYMAGEYLVRKADSLNLEHVNIVEITGTANSTPMMQRHIILALVLRKPLASNSKVEMANYIIHIKPHGVFQQDY